MTQHIEYEPIHSDDDNHSVRAQTAHREDTETHGVPPDSRTNTHTLTTSQNNNDDVEEMRNVNMQRINEVISEIKEYLHVQIDMEKLLQLVVEAHKVKTNPMTLMLMLTSISTSTANTIP